MAVVLVQPLHLEHELSLVLLSLLLFLLLLLVRHCFRLLVELVFLRMLLGPYNIIFFLIWPPPLLQKVTLHLQGGVHFKPQSNLSKFGIQRASTGFNGFQRAART